MGIPGEQIGWSNESKLLRYILKQLNRLLGLIANIPNAGNVDGLLVGDGAGNVTPAVSGTDIKTVNNESVIGSGNIPIPAGFDCGDVPACEEDPIVGAVMGIVKADGAGNISQAIPGTDYGMIVVSEIEPVNPSDGLMWYDPTPCPPTTTTTTTTEEITTTTTTIP